MSLYSSEDESEAQAFLPSRKDEKNELLKDTKYSPSYDEISLRRQTKWLPRWRIIIQITVHVALFMLYTTAFIWNKQSCNGLPQSGRQLHCKNN